MLPIHNKIGYVINIDAGSLEFKTSLLIESILQFADSDPLIIVIKPSSKQLMPTTIDKLKNYKVHYHELEPWKCWSENMLLSKIYISAFAESLYGSITDLLIFLDSDTIFLRPIDNNLISDDFSIGIRPTDFSDASLQNNESELKFWSYLLDKYKIVLTDVWSTRTNTDCKQVYASFNSGLLIAKSNSGFYNKWLTLAEELFDDQDFRRIISNDLMATHYLDQTLLDLTILLNFNNQEVKILDHNYNFSLNQLFWGRIVTFKDGKACFRKLPYEISTLIHIHYHDRFIEPRIIKYFGNPLHKELLKRNIPFHTGSVSRLITDLRKVLTFLHFVISHFYKNCK